MMTFVLSHIDHSCLKNSDAQDKCVCENAIVILYTNKAY